MSTRKPAGPTPAEPQTAPDPAAKAPAAPAHPLPPETVGTVKLSDIRAGANYRKTFDDKSLATLAESIRLHGVLKLPIVRPVGANVTFANGKWSGVDYFELVDGERRYRAAKLAGLREVLCKVRPIAAGDTFHLRAIQLAANDSEPVPPSEEAAAYREMAAGGRSLDEIADATGKPRSFVRSVLAVGRLPAWALACVDRGVLSRTCAEVVGRVPGEASRERAAGCVVLGLRNPDSLDGCKWNDCDDWREACQAVADGGPGPEPLTGREAKELVRTHFTRQLKGAAFSLKMADLVPAAGSCEDCPKRAGNDPELRAEGVRADVCVDPDCYRAKVEAHDAAELLKGTRKGLLAAPEDFTWPEIMASPPKGWCDVDAPAQLGDLSADLQGTKHGTTRLRDLLKLDRHPPGGGPPVFAALDPKHKLRSLIRTADARRLLIAAGVLKKADRKPAPRPPADSPAVSAGPAPASKTAAPPLLADRIDVHDRALANARRVLREYGEEQFAALADLPDAADGGPVLDALRLVARAFAYDRLVAGGLAESTDDVLKERFAVTQWSYEHDEDGRRIDAGVHRMTAPQVLAFLLELAAAMELNEANERETAKDMLDWAELHWSQLQDQARRELAGGEAADEKLERAEAAAESAAPAPKAKKGAKSK